MDGQKLEYSMRKKSHVLTADSRVLLKPHKGLYSRWGATLTKLLGSGSIVSNEDVCSLKDLCTTSNVLAHYPTSHVGVPHQQKKCTNT